MPYSTQQSIPIAGVKDGIIILKNGGYRMILEVAAINFSLKSEQEQNSLVFQYQSFLNSLHFPVEIVIRSKRLDLNPYLNKVRKASESSINELIKMQIGDYVDFVTKLISLANIMKKTFYVVIPYDPINIKKLNILDSLFAKTQKFDHLKIADTDFKAATSQLTERGNIIASGLGSMGLHCFQLSTEGVIELFYQIYNPEEAGKERITDASTLSSPLVIAKDEIVNSNDQSPAASSAAGSSIDNASIVEEHQKSAAQQRRQEATKEGERQIAAGQDGKQQHTPDQSAETERQTVPSNPVTPSDPASNQQSQPTQLQSNSNPQTNGQQQQQQ